MTIREIQDVPTCIESDGKWHESVTRSFHILDKVKYWIREGVPVKIILELIIELEAKPGK